MEYILLVEDDKQLSLIMKRIMASKGYGVITAFSIRQAREELKKREFDLILLDMMLPDGEGSQLCEEIRKFSTCPVIFVSCLSDQDTKISALKMGGDDYITKPVNYGELLARIEVNIRRAKQYNEKKNVSDEIHFTGLCVKRKAREAWITDKNKELKSKLELSPLEYALLMCLIDNQEELVLYQDLFKHVWQASDASDVRTVMVHVSNLRKKMGDAGSLIHTVRSAGYIFKE